MERKTGRDMTRRSMLKHALATAAAARASSVLASVLTKAPAAKPNFVVILCDDMGFADLAAFGNPVINTPNIDRLAQEGLKLTSFCVAPACSPTRGMLMTGKYPPRTGLINVTGPGSPVGIRPGDMTVAQALKLQGYRTAMFGKWHIGDFDTDPAFNPTEHGFDQFYGLPYSHDYNQPAGVPLYRNKQKIEQPVKYNLLTKRYTEEATKFIRERGTSTNGTSTGKDPFFLYLAHNMPHISVGTSPEFAGHSRAGRYGDAIEEIDWSVGEVLRALKETGKDRNTVVVFTSDNGPWLAVGEDTYNHNERGTKEVGDVGWAGLLKGGKSSTYEGGVRVPTVARWPGVFPAGKTTAELASVLDIYATFVSMAGGTIPESRKIDGVDITSLLKGGRTSPRHELFYYSHDTIQCVRQGPWKLRIAPVGADGVTKKAYGATTGEMVTELYNLDTDPSERFNRAAKEPEIVARLSSRMKQFDDALKATRLPLTAYLEHVSQKD
ncbi:MAG: sulfatase [Acidobacteria bacterium]|nr:sulfatase [Acidobacteriota bacterium]